MIYHTIGAVLEKESKMNEVETVITKTKGDLTNDEFCRKYWNEKGRDILLGAQIVKVEYMSKKETEEMGWYEQPVCLLSFFSPILMLALHLLYLT